MKIGQVKQHRCQSAAQGMLLGLALFFGGSTGAQNLLKNPGFNNPVDPIGSSGATNWAVAYAYGGPDDFCIKDRTIFAKRTSSGGAQGAFGGQFRPITEGPMHAYFKQVVTNLTPGDSYIISGWMFVTWPSGATDNKYNVYITSVGGQGSLSTPYCTNSTYTQYSVTNTARLAGSIEVQLHFAKLVGTLVTDYKMSITSGCWDDISLVHQ